MGLPEEFSGPGVLRSGVGEGWWPIIEGLHQQLLLIDPEYQIDQIKEKFGGLRYYVSPARNEDGSFKVENFFERASPLIDLAEAIAARTCEDCGRRGEARYDGWVRTQCDECYARRS